MRIWHAMWLERIDRKAADLRQRQAEEERGRARRPPAPDWILELNRATGHPLAVHAGDCGMAGRRKRPVGQDDARRLLTTDGVPACPICRPDTAALRRARAKAVPHPGGGFVTVRSGPQGLLDAHTFLFNPLAIALAAPSRWVGDRLRRQARS